MSVGSLLGGLGIGLGQGALGFIQSAMNYAFSREAQERQYKYSRKLNRQVYNMNLSMSNTAHQREVSDLRQAGLNPILSATGGNGAMSGTSAGGTVDTSGTAHAFDDTLSSALDIRRLKNETDLKESEVDVNKSNKALIDEQKEKTIYDSDVAHEQSALLNEQLRQLQSYGPLKWQAEIQNLLTGSESNSAHAYQSRMDADTNRKVGNSTAKYTDERSRGYSYSIHGPYGIGHSSTGNESTLYGGPGKIYDYFSNPDNYHYETEIINGKKVRVKVYH